VDARRWLRVVAAIPPGWVGRLPGELPRRVQHLQRERVAGAELPAGMRLHFDGAPPTSDACFSGGRSQPHCRPASGAVRLIHGGALRARGIVLSSFAG